MLRRCSLLLCALAALGIGSLGCRAGAPPQTRPIGLDAVASLDHVPLLCDFVCLQHSSYDRTGGNDDGFSGRWTHLRREANGDYVIFDAQGPGCIYRLWSAMPPEGYVKFYFDDEPAPRVQCNFRELFQSKVPPFAPPLTGQSSGGWYSYLPMPYAKRCVIMTEKKTDFLAIAYHRFPAGTAVKTFDPKLTPEERTELDAIQAWYGDPAKKEAEAGLALKWTKIAAEDREVDLAELNGPATIRGLHMKIKTELPEKWTDDPTLRKTVIRVYWDGDRSPAIECPVGEFFGTGFGDKRPTKDGKPEPLTYAAVPFGMTNDFYYFRLPMPLRKSARITIENGTGRELELGWGVDLKAGPVPDNAAYLHVQWKDHTTKEGQYVPILETTGRGHFVGTLLSMQSPWWLTYLEGDERFTVDGESIPSIHGTGTEDYFNCGWYYRDGLVSRPFHGLTVMRDPQSRTSQYRMHVPDCVPFTKSLKVEIEHGESNNKPYTDYAVVAYWYQDSTAHERQYKLPAASALRLPGTVLNDPENWTTFVSLALTLGTAEGLHAEADKVAVVPLRQFDESFEGPPRLLLTAEKPGASLRWQVECPREDLYAVRLIVFQRPEFGVSELFVDGKPTGQKLDLYSEAFRFNFEPPVKPVLLTAGPHWLELRVTEKNEKAKGWGLCATAYRIEAASAFPQEWNVSAPFPGGVGNGYGAVYPPERGVDLNGKYPGSGGKEVAWAKIKANGAVWLHEKYPPANDCVAYAHVYVKSPSERDVTGLVSTDDSGKLFVNGELVWGVTGINEVQVDRWPVPIHLKAGWNDVLIKVCQNSGAWGYVFRINDPKAELVYSTTKTE